MRAAQEAGLVDVEVGERGGQGPFEAGSGDGAAVAAAGDDGGAESRATATRAARMARMVRRMGFSLR